MALILKFMQLFHILGFDISSGSQWKQQRRFATLILATHPNVQNKLQQEIDDIIGKERSPKYVDRNQMPYLQAFMWELWRFRTITPINLPRK
jgi:cytochrome P450